MYTVNYQKAPQPIQRTERIFESVLDASEVAHDIAIAKEAHAVVIDENGEVCDEVDGRW